MYAVGHVPPSPLGRAAAAVLAAGPGAVLSHSSAAALWGIDREWRDPLEVTTSRDRRPRRLRVHRVALAPSETTTHWGIRVTAPARTVLDIASSRSIDELASAYNELCGRSFLRPGELRAQMESSRGRPGTTQIARLLGEVGDGYTRSGLERRFRRFCQERGLPTPLMNTIVLGREVDAYYPEHKLIVELDTRDYHDDPGSFERDRDNDATALAYGIRTMRITGQRLDNQPDREERRLRAACGLG